MTLKKKKREREKEKFILQNIIKYPGMTPPVKDTSKKKKKTKKVCPDEVSSSDKFFTNTNPFFLSLFLPIPFIIPIEKKKKRTKRYDILDEMSV